MIHRSRYHWLSGWGSLYSPLHVSRVAEKDTGPAEARGGLATATARNARKGERISSKVFVGNLSFDTTSDDLQELFAQGGEEVQVTVPTDRMTGRPRGFAFIEFNTPEQATQAIEKLDGFEVAGRRLRVNEATEERRGPVVVAGIRRRQVVRESASARQTTGAAQGQSAQCPCPQAQHLVGLAVGRLPSRWRERSL